ncbi:anion permease [Kineococcus gynurae]|uniref:Anion permease n=1 Tax=Kineococcus gynurae TaxID=452979 RepID=A0ABV5LPN0_9ACTN
MESFLLVLVVAVALGFAFTNGAHDAANAVATSISTRALTPGIALLLAAVCNTAGAFLGEGLAAFIGSGIVDPGRGSSGLVVILGALLGATAWNLLTWHRGLPTSSSHALIAGLAGSGLVAGTTVRWDVILTSIVLPMVASPVFGFVAAGLLMLALLRVLAPVPAGVVNRRFRVAQVVSGAAMALGHGLQATQKTMGVVILALVAVGSLEGSGRIPLWVKLSAGLALGFGTWVGGRRIIRTLGQRLAGTDPARGFAAEVVSATALYVAALGLNTPISSTHTITAAVVGAGATRRRSAVRWDVVRAVVLGWVLTVPGAGLVAAGTTALLLHLV